MTGESVSRTALDVACHLNVLVPDVSAGTLPAALDAIAAAGYARVVLPPLDAAATDAAALRAAFIDHGLRPITIAGQAPGADVSSADADERAAGAAALRSSVDLTVALGSDQMNGVPYGLFGHPSGPTSRAAFERAAHEVGTVADYAHERGVTMTFEVLNRYETSAINTAAQAMAFVAASGSAHLRIHLDTFHMAVEESDMAAALLQALPALSYLELGQSGRGALGEGSVDVENVIRTALDAGYTGRWGVEAFSRSGLSEGAADMLAIWRSPFDRGAELASDAMALIERSARRRPPEPDRRAAAARTEDDLALRRNE
ncbi:MULTISPECIES: sugar phosphate isomerase/epimerase [unclassified Microbacterium]|uniref:sugar phosphate isomerase/epimerase family protein n=1 Tax=unclassified Microbacterium TaxID=2609290 RepID=UPI00214CB633|nr:MULTISPECIES: sugar phosphate isomerase/epimerase [unclassified Microbacterium]MCR2808483.1 sugar phosphate isomerase/epimerase [Microbacterium sp. zg.B185]WIM19077.1 sugar phosphate isomerase/epimerase [Microbacterium sp. zg-B185]